MRDLIDNLNTDVFGEDSYCLKCSKYESVEINGIFVLFEGILNR